MRRELADGAGGTAVTSQRDAELVALASEHGREWTLGALGELFGITGERVRQILWRHGVHKDKTQYPLHRRKYHACRKCGAIYLYPEGGSVRFCQRHRRPPAVWLDRTCVICGKSFTVTAGTIRSGSPRQYCSKSCWGTVAGKKYGFPAHRKTRYPRRSETPALLALQASPYHIFKCEPEHQAGVSCAVAAWAYALGRRSGFTVLTRHLAPDGGVLVVKLKEHPE